MDFKTLNFRDLYEAFYVNTGAETAAKNLQYMGKGTGSAKLLALFPPASEIKRSGAILLSPVGDLLKFYSLLEIALIIKFVPEPQYTDPFWKEAAANLSSPLIKIFEESEYPVLLPQFLMGRLEGRLHLEEEGADVRSAELCGIFMSFTSLISRWRDHDADKFLRYVMSPDSNRDQLDAFRRLVGSSDDFISRILRTHSSEYGVSESLVRGFSDVLRICDDLNRLLDEAQPFPLLQSAISNYHADLFEGAEMKFPSYLLQLVESFSEWVKDEPRSEREQSVTGYIEYVKLTLDRLATGHYGGYLNPEILRPLVMK